LIGNKKKEEVVFLLSAIKQSIKENHGDYDKNSVIRDMYLISERNAEDKERERDQKVM
jgi:hypothetical protein